MWKYCDVCGCDVCGCAAMERHGKGKSKMENKLSYAMCLADLS